MASNDSTFSTLGGWVLIKDEDYARNNPPDFITHLNYVSFLQELSQNLTLDCSININNEIKVPEIVTKKINLIKLTKKGLEYEYKAVKENPEFAQICVSWISVKSYYLLFYITVILRYLISSDINVITDTHSSLIKWLNNSLKSKSLKFSKEEFNTVYSGIEIHKWKSTTGANIKRAAANKEERFLQILKKIQTYKEKDFMRVNKIANIRKKVNKEKFNEFLVKNNVTLTEFFYWYRIKANYRDLEFLDKEISIDHFSDYYCNYFELTNNMYSAFKTLIDKLCTKRGIQLLDL